MTPTHSLLRRQLRQHFGSFDSSDHRWTDLLASIDKAYQGFDTDRAMLERSLELSSGELVQANAEMRAIVEALPDVYIRLNSDGVVLDCKAGRDPDSPLAPQDLLGKRIQDGPLTSPLLDGLREVRATQSMVSVEFAATSQGSELFYEARLLPLGRDQIFVVIRDITQRKIASAALRESQRSLSTLIFTLPGMVYRCANDRDWTLEFVSEAARDLTGFSPEDFLQQRVSYGSLIHPDDQERVWKEVQDALAKQQPFELSYRIRTATGLERCVWEQGVGVFSDRGDLLALEGYVTDVTRRKLTEEALAESEARYRNLIENAHDMIQSVGPDGRFRFVNRAWTNAMGYSAEDLSSKTFFEVIHSNSLVHYQKLLQEVVSGVSPMLIKAELVANDGRSVLVEGTVTGRYVDGQLIATNAILRNVTERREWEERLEYATRHDQLTNLPNRAVFLDRLTQALLRLKAPRPALPIGVVLLDLDRFKLINDTLGHAAGDQLLVMVTARLTRCLREADTVARLGDDEFAVLLPEIAKPGDVVVVADKLIAAFQTPFKIADHEVYVTISFGISVAPHDGDDAGTLLKNADTAMYRAKDHGRNTYQLYSPAMNVSTLERLTMERSLRRALEQREFVVYYQPQIDLRSRRIVGMEALVRWQHPDLGLLSPAKFIPLAEETGLIVNISHQVLQIACTQNRAWQDAGIIPFPISVNLSARQFQQTDVMTTVMDVILESTLPPRWLELELTESLLMQDVERTVTTLGQLRRVGVRFSVDDFGTGYSSLSYLKRFPITTLKIDQTFVRHITDDADDAAIARAIIAMAHSLKLGVVAEGVEKEEQSAFLQQEGCDTIQGYLISRPIPADQMTALLQANTWFSRSGPPQQPEIKSAA